MIKSKTLLKIITTMFGVSRFNGQKLNRPHFHLRFANHNDEKTANIFKDNDFFYNNVERKFHWRKKLNESLLNTASPTPVCIKCEWNIFVY